MSNLSPGFRSGESGDAVALADLRLAGGGDIGDQVRIIHMTLTLRRSGSAVAWTADSRHVHELRTLSSERPHETGNRCLSRVSSLTVDRPQLTEENIKKLENTEAIAVDGNPIHHLQSMPQ